MIQTSCVVEGETHSLHCSTSPGVLEETCLCGLKEGGGGGGGGWGVVPPELTVNKWQ